MMNTSLVAACHSAKCAPPPTGTGGSLAAAKAEHSAAYVEYLDARQRHNAIRYTSSDPTTIPKKVAAQKRFFDAEKRLQKAADQVKALTASAAHTSSGYTSKKSIGGRSPSLRWPHLYDLLRAKGYDKEKAARISNSRVGVRKHGKLGGLPYKQADNPRALKRVLKAYQRKH